MIKILGPVFAIFLVTFLLFDLFVLNRKPHKPTLKESLLQTVFWIVCALGFGVAIWFFDNSSAYDFLTVYVTEKMLSLDNLFVILVIFGFFGIEEKYQHKTLFWGIIGAVILRAAFIFAGSAIVEHFHFVLYIFGALLIYTGYKLIAEKDEKEHKMDESKMLTVFKRFLPLTTEEHNGRFFIRHGGKVLFTSLFLTLLMIEGSDIIFAVDSIPASFSITNDPFIIFTANMFAVMGLRSLYFIIEFVLHKFHLLTKALAIVLIFIGVKFFVSSFFHIGSFTSLVIILGILGTAMVLSPYIPNKKDLPRV